MEILCNLCLGSGLTVSFSQVGRALCTTVVAGLDPSSGPALQSSRSGEVLEGTMGHVLLLVTSAAVFFF